LDGFPQRDQVEKAVAAGVNTVETSSMGRLFDAVAALLGIHYINRYEGECAILLENAAATELAQQAGAIDPTATSESGAESAVTKSSAVPPCSAGALALKFHYAVAEAILAQCIAARDALGIQIVCLGGGVFQNKILMEETLGILRANGFQPYYNSSVPPNDGGIALGQNYIGMKHLLGV
jgi:hydrogenase maturation protein HypF